MAKLVSILPVFVIDSKPAIQLIWRPSHAKFKLNVHETKKNIWSLIEISLSEQLHIFFDYTN